jgi:hypothetical protein
MIDTINNKSSLGLLCGIFHDSTDLGMHERFYVKHFAYAYRRLIGSLNHNAISLEKCKGVLMNMQAMRQYLLIASLVGVLSACTPIQAPPTTSTSAETATVPAEETPTTAEVTPDATPDAMPIESVDAAQCAALQAALAEQLGHELTQQAGTACTLVATGTGEDFGSFVDVAQTIREVFEAEGWTEDKTAAADGPTGTATNYFKDTTVATVNVGWEPSDAANCPADQPISACDIEPSQQNFTISIELVQIA